MAAEGHGKVIEMMYSIGIFLSGPQQSVVTNKNILCTSWLFILTVTVSHTLSIVCRQLKLNKVRWLFCSASSR